ncbi:hypothetical protein [Ruminococcus sp.]|uniref:hypothetical protein n=1 Tax=Ruminococcus sp. TaxID=41978 RepID=UPI0025E54527|nr:hypothetical protein [Ruminococcus sp.]MBQ9542552.1 hypothetical protein [Ruminococcus sp.]
MNGRYDKIKKMERPQYDEFPPMSAHDRAAQFSPFAALTGYDEAVNETARLTESRRELTEDDINELNETLNRLKERLPYCPDVTVTYFLPDERKSGGSYVTKRGEVRILDSYEGVLVFTDGVRIPINELFAVSIDN